MLACLWVVWLLPASLWGAEEWRLGAAPGERLRYRVHWMGITAGDASMQLESGPGRGYLLQSGLSSVGAARVIRALDEWFKVEGEHRESAFIPRQYVKDQRRDNRVKWTSYQFDREMRQVVRLRRGEEGRPDEILPIPFSAEPLADPLSLLYAVRARQELLPGQTLERLVVDGERIYCLTITVGGGRQLHTSLGEFRVFSLQVAVENSELFRQRGPIQLWLTDDARRIPIQVEAQLAFGAVVAELVAFEDGRGESRKVQSPAQSTE
ncbi:MAG: DUF3108 domain-containing protein [Magnetococcus sp. XQGC-1]